MEIEEIRDLNYWKNNCEDDYLNTPISVLRYISELTKEVEELNAGNKSLRHTNSVLRETNIVLRNNDTNHIKEVEELNKFAVLCVELKFENTKLRKGLNDIKSQLFDVNRCDTILTSAIDQILKNK